jgi:hypothetical protein
VGLIIALAGLLLLAVFLPARVLVQAQEWSGNTLDPSYLPMVLHNFKRLLLLMVFTLILVFFGLRHKLVRFGSPLLLLLLGLDLFIGNRGYAQKLDGVSFHATTPMTRSLKSDEDLFRFHVMPEKRDLSVIISNNYRDFHLKRKDALGYDLMMEHHFFDIDGYNVPLQPRYERLMSVIRNQPLASIRNLLDMMNVKYLLSESQVDISGYSLVWKGAETNKLYQNRNLMPRAFLVKNFKVLEGDQEFARAFIESDINLRETLLLESKPVRFLALNKKPAVPALRSAVKIVKYENNRMVLDVSTPQAAFLFTSETYYPGWKAYVDGREEEILRANYAFRAIPVGPGSHRVEVVYQSLSFKIGLAVSLLTIFLLIAGWIIWARRKGRREKSIGLRAALAARLYGGS